MNKFLNIKKNKLPSAKSLRPRIFDVKFYWLIALLVAFLILAATALVGFRFFYSQYFETYKKAWTAENFEGVINVSRLKGVIEKRHEFINSQTSFPKDPSL